MELTRRSATIAVIVGPHEINIASIDSSSGKIIKKSSHHIYINSVVSTLIETLCKALKINLKATYNSGNIKLSVSAPFNYSTGVGYFKEDIYSDTFLHFDFGKSISESLEDDVKLNFFNHACCLLKGEQVVGSLEGYRNIAAFSLDDTFGSALSLSNSLEDANYWSHPFKAGTCNDYFSEKWFIKRYKAITVIGVNNLAEIISVARKKKVDDLFEEFSINITAFISEVCKKHTLECIILGGKYTEIWNISLPMIRIQMAIIDLKLDIKVSRNGLRNSLIGAANL